MRPVAPRKDVQSGVTKDEQFAADLAQVVNKTAPPEYLDPAIFFRHSYPTRGLQTLLKAVCERLNGESTISPVIRLHTQYGGGKTHGLIALVHAVRGMKGVENANEFINRSLLPKQSVRIAALDGDNSDPSNGRVFPAVALSPEERSLYEAVEDYISKTYNKADLNKRSAVGFVMTIYRRRLASSFQALQKTLVGRLNRLPFIEEEDLLPDETGDSDTTDAPEADQLMNEAAKGEETSEIKALLKRISQLPTDSKALHFLEEL